MDEIVRFGPGQQLVGILSGSDLAINAPVLVLPSAGVVPRAGPFRLHVELARRLSAHGVRTFRFDVPGVGEAPRIKGCGAQEATLAALECLAENHGAERFVVGGVCSAADLAWSAAASDQRVRGVVLLDGLAFGGPWFRFALIIGVLRRPIREWFAVARRLLVRSRSTEPVLSTGDYRDWPSREDARRQFAQLVAEDVHSLWVYTGGFAGVFLHPRQFAWSFGAAARDRRVAMHYWPDCDHTFFARTHRDRLLDTVVNWLGATFMANAATPQPVPPPS
ncbi:MAG: alpha/beta fold hydrolase [Lysobacter sp.]